MTEHPGVIAVPYLLVLFSPTQYRDRQGHVYLDRLWAADLLQHVRYLKQLTVCSYAAKLPEGPSELVRIDDDPAFREVKLVGLHRPRNLLDALLRVPVTAWRLWREVRNCAIVHSSVAAWPIPEAWFVTPMARWLSKPHVIVVESAFWRLSSAQASGGRTRRARAALQERAARWCLDRADLSIFTHDGYRQTLLRRPAEGHVIQASWLSAAWILSNEALDLRVAERLAEPGTRVAFLGRLNPEKGSLDAIAACLQAEREDLDIRLDVYGQGPLLEEAQRLAATSPAGRIRICGTVRYGDELMQCLSGYDAVLVPTRSDEQPRVVYDAYARGVPVIASDTPGHRECVLPGVTGCLFGVGDVGHLAGALRRVVVDKSGWLSQGRACLDAAREQTHEAMHQRRRLLLAGLLAAKGG